MDQSTTNLPSVIYLSKALASLCHIQTHLVGSIMHSGQATVAGKEIYGSVDYYQWPHDSNLTCTVLLESILKWTETKLLPPVLYLQMDNCVRENKNKFVFVLLAVLVELKIFQKVRFLCTVCTFYMYLLNCTPL